MDDDMTAKQEATVSALEKKRFIFTKVSRYGDAYLHFKKGATTFYAEVDRDGLVNGAAIEDFLKQVRF